VASAFLSSFFLANFISVLGVSALAGAAAGADAAGAGAAAIGVFAGCANADVIPKEVIIAIANVFILSFLYVNEVDFIVYTYITPQESITLTSF
jgi:hypothetical protein